MRRLGFFVFVSGLLAASPAIAQSAAVIGHVTGGVGNFHVPSFSGGVDVIGRRGVSVGAGAAGSFWHTGIFGGDEPWGLVSLSGRVGLHSVGTTAQRVQRYVVGEVAVVRGFSCCGGTFGTGVSAGIDKWVSARRALRVEGRLLVPHDQGVALILVNVGMAFR